MMQMDEHKFYQAIESANVLAPEKLKEAESVAKSTGTRLYEVLTERNILADAVIGVEVAKTYKVPFVDLSAVSIPDNLLRVVPERVAKKKRCLIFERSGAVVKLATENPTDAQVAALVSAKTGAKVEVYYATPIGINKGLDNFKTDIKKAFQDLADEAEKKDDKGDSGEEAPVSELVDIIFEHSYKQKTSDIHLEPQENQGIVRYRIDGVLHDIVTTSKSIHERIISRLKVLAKLRTDEHLATQDGKIRTNISGQAVDIRLSILPIVDGEKAVMRVLSTHGRALTLEDLGMRPPDLERVKSGYTKSFGMVLTTGPTGSGKSTSIYAILRILNTRDINITTIEDPVEYRIKGMNQINVNAKTGLTFAAGLRAILRQDPNVVSVGEIRDGETATVAVNAALTGHLVLSTLHTNDAATTMVRLIDMKVEPFLVASTVNVIIAQRLVRKVCKDCRTPYKVTREYLVGVFGHKWVDKYVPQTLNEVDLYKGVGCKFCSQTGYIGRIGLYETLLVTPRIRQLTIEKASSDVINAAAIEEGMTLMGEDGLIKVLQGQTSAEEVLRVTKTEA
jgi:type IV pilus assembly protein PilB